MEVRYLCGLTPTGPQRVEGRTVQPRGPVSTDTAVSPGFGVDTPIISLGYLWSESLLSWKVSCGVDGL